MLASNRVKILQRVVNDPASTEVERAEATRELNATDQSAPSSPRRGGRNSGVPLSQSDLNGEIENWYRRVLPDSNLTGSDRREIFQGFDLSTQAILNAFTSHVLQLFADNAAEIQLLIDLHRRTHSDFVRAKTNATIQWIADYSPIESAKLHAQEFLQGQQSTNQIKGELNADE
jgi:hypothetical protein